MLTMRRQTAAAIVLGSIVALCACQEEGQSFTAPAAVFGTWSVQVTNPGDSELVGCNVTFFPPMDHYVGQLVGAESVGTIEVDQFGGNFTILEIVDTQPSGLEVTWSGEGAVLGDEIAAVITVTMREVAAPAEPFVTTESVTGEILDANTLRLVAQTWSTNTETCLISPPLVYHVTIR